MTDSALTIVVGGVVSCVTAICTAYLGKKSREIRHTVNGQNDALREENTRLHAALRAAAGGRRSIGQTDEKA